MQRRPLAATGRRSQGIPILSWRESSDLLRISLFALILVNVSAIQMYLGPIRLLRPGLMFLLLAGMALVMRPAAGGWGNLNTWPSKAVLAFFALTCCSAFFGISLGTSALYIMNVYYLNILFFLLLVLAIRSVKDLALLMWAFVISVGIVVVLAQTVLDMDVTREGLGRLNGGYGSFDANDLGMILVIALPIALQFFLNSRSVVRWISAALLVSIPVTVALTGSRGAMVGLVAVGVAVLLGMTRLSFFKRVIVIGAAIAGLNVGAPPGYWKQMATLLNLKEDYNYSVDYGRKAIARRGMGYMMRYPVFGVGIANFPRAEGTISTISRRRAEQGLSVQFVAAHNTYVQVGAETGVTGLAIWVALLYSGTIGLLLLRRRIPVSWDTSSPERRFLRESCLFLPFGFLAFAVSSSFLSHGYTVILYMLVAYVAAIRVLVKQELRKDQQGTVLQSNQPGIERPRMRASVMRGYSGAVGRRRTGT